MSNESPKGNLVLYFRRAKLRDGILGALWQIAVDPFDAQIGRHELRMHSLVDMLADAARNDRQLAGPLSRIAERLKQDDEQHPHRHYDSAGVFAYEVMANFGLDTPAGRRLGREFPAEREDVARRLDRERSANPSRPAEQQQAAIASTPYASAVWRADRNALVRIIRKHMDDGRVFDEIPSDGNGVRIFEKDRGHNAELYAAFDQAFDDIEARYGLARAVRSARDIVYLCLSGQDIKERPVTRHIMERVLEGGRELLNRHQYNAVERILFRPYQGSHYYPFAHYMMAGPKDIYETSAIDLAIGLADHYRALGKTKEAAAIYNDFLSFHPTANFPPAPAPSSACTSWGKLMGAYMKTCEEALTGTLEGLAFLQHSRNPCDPGNFVRIEPAAAGRVELRVPAKLLWKDDTRRWSQPGELTPVQKIPPADRLAP